MRLMRDPNYVRLVTERMDIRLPRKGDEGPICEYYTRNREFLQPWSPTLDPELFIQRVWRDRIDAIRAEYRGGRAMRLFFFSLEDPRIVVGMAGLTSISGFPTWSCTLGYSVSEEAQGKGYATEAVAAIVEFCFKGLQLHRVEANYMPRNERSARVLEKNGFVIEGRSAGYVLINGVWEEHIRTARVNPDWSDGLIAN